LGVEDFRVGESIDVVEEFVARKEKYHIRNLGKKK
jgi:hypothetical protein